MGEIKPVHFRQGEHLEYGPHRNCSALRSMTVCWDCGKSWDTNDSFPLPCRRSRKFRVPEFLRARLRRWATCIIDSRPPDMVIGGDNPYLLRWRVIPPNRWFNIYLHGFLRSDDDRALHDHPWVNASILLAGGYKEVRFIKQDSPEYGYRTVIRVQGDIVVRPRAAVAHRIALFPKPGGGERSVLSLFITGPRTRDWGFHCPKRWVPWREFTNPGSGGASSLIGPGCDDEEKR